MKGKIDKLGKLHIWRDKSWKIQDCPHGVICGDHCALFGEPSWDGHGGVDLSICNGVSGTIWFSEFTDERGE